MTPISEDIMAEAATWVAHRRETVRSTERDEAFFAWMEADPRHAEAFERLWLTLEDIASLSHLSELVPDEAGGGVAAGRWSWAPRAARWSAVAASLVLAGLASLWFLDRPDMSARTPIAQTRVIALADGSRVTLGADSAIEVDLSAGERRVSLVRGEAFFEVARDVHRPFLVLAGDTRVRVLGTKFDVRRSAERVKVSVLEGVVEVKAPARVFASGQVSTLRASQAIDTPLSVGLLDVAPPLAKVAAIETVPGGWRTGRLTYFDAPLSDIVEDLNRYHAPGLRIADPALGNARIAVSLRPDEIESFVGNLPMLVKAEIRRESDGAIVIDRAKR
ncbi:FecR family protein [Sphingomonas colocasiae]|uniref:FecR domain-containing protein n=1 Tax=Sphingomonas colocasiae TaxID=1848973 RepID=A0ABS7PRC8_9SPHN|nr:FecR domain-containing protein [Sphingomonas colocasiae]MBY8823230.1 FecR domain-containing protein [Sphingomonas colocasiae]